jgi:hypothetical protein
VPFSPYPFPSEALSWVLGGVQSFQIVPSPEETLLLLIMKVPSKHWGERPKSLKRQNQVAWKESWSLV